MTERLDTYSWPDRHKRRDRARTAPPLSVRPTSPSGTVSPYTLAALHSEAEAVAMAAEGTRNDTLNVAAYNLGQLVGAGHVDELTVTEELAVAARACGLPEAELQGTIRSGLQAGRQSPRVVPEMRDQVAEAPAPELRSSGEGDPVDAHEQLVQRELRQLRVREEARRRLTLETRPAAAQLDVGTLSEVLARPKSPAHRVEGLIPWEAGTLLTAQRKTGKTTTVLNLARSLLTGEDFLGRFGVRPLDGLVALLNFEVSGAQLARWASEVGVPADRVLLVNLRGQRSPLGSAEDRAPLAEVLRARGVEAVVCDPFGRAYTGTSQNDAGEVGAFLGQLDQFARTEVQALDLVLTAHAGWNGERTRGSTALEDWADSIVMLTRDEREDGDGGRYLRAVGRDVDLEEDRLGFDTETRRLTLSGSGSRRTARAGRHADDLRAVVLQVVVERPGATGAEVERQLRERGFPFQKGQERRALAALVESGEVRREDGQQNRRLHFPASASPTLPTPPHGDSGEPPHPPYIGGWLPGDVQDGQPPRCETCGELMAVVEPGQTSHPGCGDA